MAKKKQTKKKAVKRIINLVRKPVTPECKHFDFGECKRYPPQRYYSLGIDKTIYPKVLTGCRCGEYHQKDEV